MRISRSVSSSQPGRLARPGRAGALSTGLLIGLVALLLLVVLPGGCAVAKYNGIVTHREAVDAKWGDVQSDYKRRTDLIPQLVETVKGAKEFESETLQAVDDARANATKTTIDASQLGDPAKVEAFLAAQTQLGSALSRLLVTVEKYPELKAVGAFRDLQVQLEGTENRINTSRKDYIDAVRAYNTSIVRFPGNLIAGFGGFEKLPQFEVAEADTQVPVVDFGGR
jgi:LemA protein